MTPPENISKPYLFISIFILNHISYNAKLIIVLKKAVAKQIYPSDNSPITYHYDYLPSLALPKASVAIIAAYNSSGVTSPARLCIVSPFTQAFFAIV